MKCLQLIKHDCILSSFCSMSLRSPLVLCLLTLSTITLSSMQIYCLPEDFGNNVIEVLYFLSFLNRKNSIIINVFMNREDFHRYINIIDTTYVNNKKKSINNKRPYTWRVTYIACTITNTSKRKK